nr:MAG TPA: minor tail protein [Caudoviricetes sp.]
MASKEIKFNLRLAIDGKEQLGVITSSAKDVVKTLDEAKGAAARFSDKIASMNQAIGALNGLRTVLQDLTGESASFAKSMAITNTMAGKGGKDFAALKDSVTELSKEIPLTRDELANGLYQVISNGVPEDNWLDYLRASAKASVGGVADLGEAVKVTSTLIKNYGLSWQDATAIQDKIQLTAKNGVTSFEQMAQALPRVSGNAATLGVSVDDLMATFATLTGVTGNTSEVSTQLAAVFTALIKPSSEATKMAQQMGIEFNAAAIKSAGGFRQFLTQLDASVKGYAQSSGMLSKEVYAKLFGSAESLRALGPLTTQLKDKFAENAEAMKGSAGTMDKAFKTVAATGGSASQMLKNRFSVVYDAIAAGAKAITPVLSFIAQFGLALNAYKAIQIAATGVLKAFTFAMQTLHVKELLVLVRTKAITLAQATWRATCLVSAATTRVLSGALVALGVSANVAKGAIRGLLASTGVGIAIAALGFAVEKVIGYFDKSTESIEDNTDALKENRRATTQAERNREALNSIQKTAADKYADEKARIAALTQIIHNSNAEYAERMSAIKRLQSIIPSYHAQISKDGSIYEKNAEAIDKYIKKLDELAWAEAAADMIKDLNKQIITFQLKADEDQGRIDEYQNNINERNKQRHGGAIDITRPDTYKVDGTPLTAKQIAENRQIDNANARTKGFQNNVQKDRDYNLGRANDAMEKKNAVFAMAGRRGYTSALHNALTGNAETIERPAYTPPVQTTTTTNKSTHTPTHTPTETDTAPTYDEKSIEWYDKEISKQKELAQSTNNLDAAKKAMAEATRLEGERKELAVKVGIEKPDAPEVKTALEALQDQLRAAQTDFDNAVTVEAKVEAMTKVDALQAQINEATNGRLTIEAEVEPQYTQRGSVGDKRKSYANAQTKASRVKNDYDIGLISKEEAQKQVDDINKVLSSLKLKPITVDFDTTSVEKGTGKMREGAQSIQQLGSSIAQLGSQVQEPALNIAGVIAQSIATMVLGYAEASKDASKLTPFGWIAFAATGLATLLTMIASIKSATSGSYAHGGIIPGGSYSGDRLTANVNSGEMIINRRQQLQLWRMVQAPLASAPQYTTPSSMVPSLNLAALRSSFGAQRVDVNVSGRISGRDLQLISDKRNKITSRA